MNALHPIFKHLLDGYADAGLLPKIAKPDPLAELETAEGILAQSEDETRAIEAQQANLRG